MLLRDILSIMSREATRKIVQVFAELYMCAEKETESLKENVKHPLMEEKKQGNQKKTEIKPTGLYILCTTEMFYLYISNCFWKLLSAIE